MNALRMRMDRRLKQNKLKNENHLSPSVGEILRIAQSVASSPVKMRKFYLLL